MSMQHHALDLEEEETLRFVCHIKVCRVCVRETEIEGIKECLQKVPFNLG